MKQSRLDVLLNEKDRLVAEKLGVIQTIKQSYAYAGVILSLLLVTAEGSDVPQANLAIPWVSLAIGLFVLTNLQMLSLIAGHLALVDAGILDSLNDTGDEPSRITVPLWHAGTGRRSIDWRFNLLGEGNPFVPNPYYLLGILFVLSGVAVTVISTYGSYVFLRDAVSKGLAVGYVGLVSIALIFAASVMLLFMGRREQIRAALLDGSA